MKLTQSNTSPYVRKALVCAILRGIADRVEPWAMGSSDPGLPPFNPLAKIPTLVTDDGMAIYDSPVVCEYLDSVGDAPPLIPPAGPARWRALTLAALGDGILDATQPRRRELTLPPDEGRTSYIALQRGKVERAIAALEATELHGLATIGEVTVACALGYLDFRYQHEPWRPAAPKLAAWYAEVSKLPALATTMPPTG